MNRSIKFRVWIKNMSYYVYPENYGYMSFAMKMAGELSHLSGAYWLTSDNIAQQFTGLTDKNGKEIYEGDILEHVIPDCCYGAGTKAHGIVKSAPWSFVITPINYNSLMRCYGDKLTYSWIYLQEAFVIGNIFENKDLLK